MYLFLLNPLERRAKYHHASFTILLRVSFALIAFAIKKLGNVIWGRSRRLSNKVPRIDTRVL